VIILDLDHTLICAVYKPIPGSTEIFSRENGLIVLERPYARPLVDRIKQNHSLVVYTSALAWYARKVMRHFDIDDQPLFSRSSCYRKRGYYQKSLSQIGVEPSDSVVILDDSPQYWNSTDLEHCKLLAPSRWMGDPGDEALLHIASEV